MSLFENEDFNRIVYTIDENTFEINAHTLKDLCIEYGEEKPTPRGVEKTYFVEGVNLWKWSFGMPMLVEKHETEEAAEYALLCMHLFDLESGDNTPIVYNSFEDAVDAVTYLRCG